MGDEKRGFLCTVGRGLDLTRRVFVNTLFLAIVIALLVVVLKEDGPKVPKSTALVVKPAGVIVEQLDGDPMDRAIEQLTGSGEAQTLLRDLLDSIEMAKDDERVKVLLLDLNGLTGAGLTKLQDVGAAIDDFKESGKTVVATADNYGQSAYYLAAHADEIYVHRMGMVLLEGFGRYRTYYKDGIDRLEIDWNIFRVGQFKSAVEPYMRSGMSEEARRANLEWLGDLWQAYLEDVAAARGLTAGDLVDYIERFREHLDAAGGDTARMAVDAGLVDRAVTRDEVRQRLIELVGENEDTHSYHRVSHAGYLEAEGGDRSGADAKGDVVGVIVARGSILDGSQPPGKIGGDSTAALIRNARLDDAIKALVLRVDSGGGSAFASEVIRHECELVREAGKPVVVSMSSVAASGGYWVSMASDEVWAYPTTITGSIGIFGMFPTFQKPLAKYLGVRVDGVGTTRLTGAVRPDRALDPEVGEVIQTMIDQGYEEFITKAAEARGVTPEEIHEIAQGRVWSGGDAHRLGLVDDLGSFDDALSAAARLADLGDDYAVKYIEKELKFSERLAVEMLTSIGRAIGPEVGERRHAGRHMDVIRLLARHAETLAELNDPNGVYAHCLCEVE